MKLRLAVMALGGIAIGAVSAGAQLTNVQAHFVSGSVFPSPGVIDPTGSYYVGPYTGQITIGKTTVTVPFNCVDFFHDVVNSQNWTADLSNIGTGWGINGPNAVTRVTGSQTINGITLSADDIYKAAAFLVSTYPAPTNPVSAADQLATNTIQDEVWDVTSVFNPGQTRTMDHLTFNGEFSTLSNVVPLGSPAGTLSAQQTAVNAEAASIQTDDVGFNSLTDPDNWWVLTVNPIGDTSGPQEFIVHATFSTPEPDSLTLMASGLFAVIGAGFVRRRKQTRTEM